MLMGYTYSKSSKTSNYYCSKKDQGCKARLKLDQDGKIVRHNNLVHGHPPPQYREITYQFLKTRQGGNLLMVNGYTYSQRSCTMNYYCSKKDKGCKVGVKLDINGRLTFKNLYVHNHPPPKYHITETGSYVKLSS
ncbi:unnamed protein product [Euphydryas editha]|uniref:FLYWCH-type domain-containing protein n=1 Tax=Euphydryas editha TaxID=104508 RepID=A0AAU9TDR2_EUPED|nr:unnamed protein product [Euphydryas editha]